MLTTDGRQVAKQTAADLQSKMPVREEILTLPPKCTISEEAREQERKTLAEQQARTSVQRLGNRMFEAAQAKYAQDIAAY